MYVNRKTVDEIKSSLPSWLQDYYITTQMDRIKIDGIEFTGYFEISDLDEINYFKEPFRSSGGSIDNLNSYARFITPHLLIRYNFMNIEEYRTLMKLLQSKAEFVFEYYNLVWDKRVQHKMYFIPSSMPKIYQKALRALGILDYTVEMVGTNTDLDKLSVVYHLNPPTEVSDQTYANEDVIKGMEILIGKNASFQTETFNNKYKFKNWNEKTDGSGLPYLDNTAYTVNYDTILYAIWESSTEYVLSYNYGFGETKIGDDNEPLYNKTVVLNTAIGTLPTTSATTVTYNEQQYTPYTNVGWYKTPQIGIGSVALTSASAYDVSGNLTIYQIFNPKEYTILFNSNDGSYTPNNMTQGYGTSIYEPQAPTKSGYTFNGWWTTATFEENTKFTFNQMPPLNISLYAKWESA